MGKDDKEDSGFGFKDKAKAEETLRLLQAHDVNYRRLTVRGLLGRAKRVLGLTKAEDKVKNIKEAMTVFENWLAELDGEKKKEKETEDKRTEGARKRDERKRERERSSDKDSASDSDEKSLPSESVPGLGFKDKAAAEESLRLLAGRDPDYQLLAVKGLVRNAKRVLTCTRDSTKLSNIKESIALFDQFMDDFESQHRSRDNCPYLSVGIVRTARGLAADVSEEQKSFLSAYEAVRGEYKRLRNVPARDSDRTWDVVRNDALKELKEKYSESKLFNENDEPTPEHLQFLLWAYSPEAARVKKVVKETREERKRKSSASEESSSKKKK